MQPNIRPSMDAQNQIINWQEKSKADLKDAENFIKKERVLHGLFLCHLAIEKILKAFIVKLTGKSAPKSHDILSLAENANLKFTNDELDFISSLITYKLHGRYPKGSSEIPSQSYSNDLLKKTSLFINKHIKKL